MGIDIHMVPQFRNSNKGWETASTEERKILFEWMGRNSSAFHILKEEIAGIQKGIPHDIPKEMVKMDEDIIYFDGLYLGCSTPSFFNLTELVSFIEQDDQIWIEDKWERKERIENMSYIKNIVRSLEILSTIHNCDPWDVRIVFGFD
jgi:hypothetical protein